MTVGDWLLLPRLNARLIGAPLPLNQAFVYFFAVLAFDGLQLAILDGSSHDPGPLGSTAAGASFVLALAFLFATFLANGGSQGRDYFARYFSVTALVGLYTAGPLQVLLRLPSWVPDFAPGPWYAPTFVLGTNLLMFSIIIANIRSVAHRTRWAAV